MTYLRMSYPQSRAERAARAQAAVPDTRRGTGNVTIRKPRTAAAGSEDVRMGKALPPLPYCPAVDGVTVIAAVATNFGHKMVYA